MCGGRGTRLDAPESRSGTRRDEKPLVEVGGVPMIDRVLAALYGSDVETVYPVTSPHVPTTCAYLDALLDGHDDGSRVDVGLAIDGDHPASADRPPAIEVVDAPGEGYVSDLRYALDRVSPPVLTVACDLPLLAPDAIDRVLGRAESVRGSLAVCVPAALKRQLGVSTDSTWEHAGRELAPTGLNVVANEPERTTTDRDETYSANDTGTIRSGTVGTDTAENGYPEETCVSHDARLAVNVNRPGDLAVAEALCE